MHSLIRFIGLLHDIVSIMFKKKNNKENTLLSVQSQSTQRELGETQLWLSFFFLSGCSLCIFYVNPLWYKLWYQRFKVTLCQLRVAMRTDKHDPSGITVWCGSWPGPLRAQPISESLCLALDGARKVRPSQTKLFSLRWFCWAGTNIPEWYPGRALSFVYAHLEHCAPVEPRHWAGLRQLHCLRCALQASAWRKQWLHCMEIEFALDHSCCFGVFFSSFFICRIWVLGFNFHRHDAVFFSVLSPLSFPQRV